MIDLDKLRKKLAASLKRETPESLRAFVNFMRSREDAASKRN